MVLSVQGQHRRCEGIIQPSPCGSSHSFFPLSCPERAPEGSAPGRAADLGRGDGIAAEDVPEHGRLGGRAGGRPDGSQHPGGRSVLRWGERGWAEPVHFLLFLTIWQKTSIGSCLA